MTKRILAVLILVLTAGGLSAIAAAGKTVTLRGIVTDQMCASKKVVTMADLKDADCARKCVGTGSKWALYHLADKKVYVLTPADKVSAQAGKTVTIKGTLDGDTITVTSVTPAGS